MKIQGIPIKGAVWKWLWPVLRQPRRRFSLPVRHDPELVALEERRADFVRERGDAGRDDVVARAAAKRARRAERRRLVGFG